MAQHTIGVSGVVFEMVQKCRMKLAMRGKEMSMSLLMDFLCNFYFTISDRMSAVSDMSDDAEKAKAWTALISEAVGYIPRTHRRRFNNIGAATLARRLKVAQDLEHRLGMESPSTEMINWWLQFGNEELMRRMVAFKNGNDITEHQQALELSKILSRRTPEEVDEYAKEEVPIEPNTEGEPFPL